MKAYLVKVLIVDHEDVGRGHIEYYIQNNVKYISPIILSTQAADIGKWDDDHPLNNYASLHDAAKAYFPEN